MAIKLVSVVDFGILIIECMYVLDINQYEIFGASSCDLWLHSISPIFLFVVEH